MKKQKYDIAEINNKVPKWIIAILITNMVLVLSLGALFYFNQKKTAFVDLGVLYDGFEMAKKKNAEIQSMSFQFKNTLDSLALEIQSMENELNISYNKDLDLKLQQKKINYYKIEENMQAKLNEEKGRSDEQIWQQINSYTQEYGKLKDYDYIYGGNGSGSMMYANENRDISEEVLNYINKKYLGE